jgi:hypothetical protein
MDRKLRWIAAAALAGIVGFGVAADAGEGDAAAETPSQVCLTPAAWTVPGGERSPSDVTALTEMAKRQVVLLG